MKSIMTGVIILVLWIPVFSGTSSAKDDAISLEPLVAIAQLDKTQRIAHLITLAIVDYQQTVAAVIKRPDQFIEMNPILGEHPNRTELAVFGIFGVVTTAMIGEINHPLTEIVVNSIIASEQLNILENQHMKERTQIPIMIVASFRF